MLHHESCKLRDVEASRELVVHIPRFRNEVKLVGAAVATLGSLFVRHTIDTVLAFPVAMCNAFHQRVLWGHGSARACGAAVSDVSRLVFAVIFGIHRSSGTRHQELVDIGLKFHFFFFRNVLFPLELDHFIREVRNNDVSEFLEVCVFSEDVDLLVDFACGVLRYEK